MAGYVTREELLRGACELVPVLRKRAVRAEQLRQIPPESVRDLQSSGLIRIGNPDRYGGHGVEIDAAFDVGWELGRGCGSTAWCYSLWTVHNWWLGHFPERAQEDFFAGGPDTLFSSGLNPAGGKAGPVDGGFRLSGRWGFSSGCDRDAHGASHHAALSWDVVAEQFGRQALGLSPGA